MSLTDEVLKVLQDLPPDKQQKVLDYVRTLEVPPDEQAEVRPLEGLWADLGFTITEEDIAQARREMWGNFPRDFPE